MQTMMCMDAQMPWAQDMQKRSPWLQHRRRRQKKAVTYIEVEHGGHSMTNTAARREILTALEIFLAENLDGS